MTRKYVTYKERKDREIWNKIERVVFEFSMTLLAFVISGMLAWIGVSIINFIESLF
jgi:hypothetical protein